MLGFSIHILINLSRLYDNSVRNKKHEIKSAEGNYKD